MVMGRSLPRVRFGTDARNYRSLVRYARRWPHRIWAVEGADGAGRPLTQRLLADGERVQDVPAKLAARVRALDTGQGRKSDPVDAHSIAAVALRTPGLRELHAADGDLVALRLLADRRDELSRTRAATLNRIHRLLAELIGGGAPRHLTALQAKRMLATVRPRDVAGRHSATDHRRPARRPGPTRRHAETPGGRVARRRAAARLAPDGPVRDGPGRGRPGLGRRRRRGPVPDQGPLRRVERHRPPGRLLRGRRSVTGSPGPGTGGSTTSCTSWPSSRSATTPAGRAYYRRLTAAGKTPMEALRILKRRLSDVVYRQLVADQLLAATQAGRRAGPGGHVGATTALQRGRPGHPDGRLFGTVTARTRHHPRYPRRSQRRSSTTSTSTSTDADRPEETRRASAGAGPSLPTIALARARRGSAVQGGAAGPSRQRSAQRTLDGGGAGPYARGAADHRAAATTTTGGAAATAPTAPSQEKAQPNPLQ